MCIDDPRCEWVWGGEDLPGGGGMCECFQDENGREICECVDVAPAPEGWCVDAQDPPPDGCEQFMDPDRCEANPECGWQDFDCECFEGMDGDVICPPCPAPGGFCSPREFDRCEGFGEAICVDVEGCEWIPDGDDPGEGEPVEPGDREPGGDDGAGDPGPEDPADPNDPAAGGGEAARPAPCPCEPGPDGEIICDCDDPIEPPPPAGGRCVTAPPAGEQCWGYGPDECEADRECGLIDNGGMGRPNNCPPCEPGQMCPPCDALIAPAEFCAPLEVYCNAQPAEQCDPNRCAVEEREICFGGGGDPVECPPGEPCMEPAPPPPDGECVVERVCVAP